jgi:hypothetical protein
LGAQIKEREIGGVCSTHERVEKCTDFSLAKDDVNGALRRLWRGWKDNIRKNAKVTGLQCVD